jgi:hypothetical protein
LLRLTISKVPITIDLSITSELADMSDSSCLRCIFIATTGTGVNTVCRLALLPVADEYWLANTFVAWR